MKQEYESIVRLVCGDDWNANYKSMDEKDGGFGIAIVLAFIKGVNNRLQDFSRELEVPPYVLEMSYKRLQLNGILSSRSWVLTDKILVSQEVIGYDSMSRMRAWCHIAGLSSGFTGLGSTREETSR